MHHVLYSWSELVEIDKHCQHLEDAINNIDELVVHLQKTDNQSLYSSNLIILKMNYQTNLKKYSHSSQIINQSKYNDDNDGDWDDILSPDDYEDYLELRRQEKLYR